MLRTPRITCTVHRTVISIEHLAIASAGFFVLLASFAVYALPTVRTTINESLWKAVLLT